MKLLVTGSEGSLMQAVIPRLLQQGHSVVGVDNCFRYGRVARERDYEFLEGDLTDRAFTRQAVRGVQGIIQAAARIFGVGGFHGVPADILAHDVTLHQNVLWSALEEGVAKVSYISSSMVYERSEKHPSPEDAALDARIPYTDYGLSKVVGERLSMAFRRQYGLKYVIWRPFNIITPHEEAGSEQGISHVFADFIHAIVAEQRNPLPLIGDGEQVRCFTWIGDVAETIARYTFVDTTDDQVYNLGNPEPITMKQLAQLIYGEAAREGLLRDGKRPLEFVSTTTFADDVRIRIPDVSKAERELTWRPTVKVADAVRHCVKEFATRR